MSDNPFSQSKLSAARMRFLRNTAQQKNTISWMKQHYNNPRWEPDWEVPWESWRDPFMACMKNFDYTEKRIIEIGSYFGWWFSEDALATELQDAKQIIAVDVIASLKEKIKLNLTIPDNIKKKITCYTTEGSDLGIAKSNTIDLVFSFDTFVRLPLPVLQEYMKEIYRVLKPSGIAVLHLASEDMLDPEHRLYENFYSIIATEQIQELITKNNFTTSKMEYHEQGLILHLTK